MKRPTLKSPEWGGESDPVCLLDGRTITDRWTGWQFTCPPKMFWSKPKISPTEPITLHYTTRGPEDEYSVQIMPDLGPIADEDYDTEFRDLTTGMINEMKRMFLRRFRRLLEKTRVQTKPKSTVTHDDSGESGTRAVILLTGDMVEAPTCRSR